MDRWKLNVCVPISVDSRNWPKVSLVDAYCLCCPVLPGPGLYCSSPCTAETPAFGEKLEETMGNGKTVEKSGEGRSRNRIVKMTQVESKLVDRPTLSKGPQISGNRGTPCDFLATLPAGNITSSHSPLHWSASPWKHMPHLPALCQGNKSLGRGPVTTPN